MNDLSTLYFVRIGRGAYQIVEQSFQIQTHITGYNIDEPLYSLDESGLLTLKVGFAWDGPTGARNTITFILSSGVHDAFCEMINKGLIPEFEQCRVDELMAFINEQVQLYFDGETDVEIRMDALRRFYSYIVVRAYQYLNKSHQHRKTVFRLQIKN